MGGNNYHSFEGYPYFANSEKHTGVIYLYL